MVTKEPPNHLLLNNYYVPGAARCPHCHLLNLSFPERWVLINPTLQMKKSRLREANLCPEDHTAGETPSLGLALPPAKYSTLFR